MSACSASSRLRRFGDLLRLDPRPQIVEQGLGDAESDVGAQQRLLELHPRLVGDRRPPEHAGERTREGGAGLGEPLAQRDRLDRLGLDDDHARRRRRSARRAPWAAARSGAARARSGRLDAAERRRLTTSTPMPNTSTATARTRNIHSIAARPYLGGSIRGRAGAPTASPRAAPACAPRARRSVTRARLRVHVAKPRRRTPDLRLTQRGGDRLDAELGDRRRVHRMRPHHPSSGAARRRRARRRHRRPCAVAHGRAARRSREPDHARRRASSRACAASNSCARRGPPPNSPPASSTTLRTKSSTTRAASSASSISARSPS